LLKNKKQEMVKTQFNEMQMFTQWWLWTLLSIVGLIPVYGIYKQFIIGDPWGDNPMSNIGLLVFAGLVFGLIYFFTKLTLETEIDNEKIAINFLPLTSKTWYWEDVESWEIIDYGFVGGWGIRFSRKGTVYNVDGRIGLLITMLDGKKYIIGTQKYKELEDFLINLKPYKT
jgi:hypothetical protein